MMAYFVLTPAQASMEPQDDAELSIISPHSESHHDPIHMQNDSATGMARREEESSSESYSRPYTNLNQEERALSHELFAGAFYYLDSSVDASPSASKVEVEGAEEDERTLLDIFGEVSKEFLTQRVIPDTDEECRWDWRSLRCEPACECMFEGKWGDYHLGRSCRLQNIYSENGDDGGNINTCIPVDPAVVLREAPVPKRIISLVSQTIDIVHNELQRLMQQFRNKIIHRWEKAQHHLCRDTWALAERIMAHRVQQQLKASSGNTKNITCIPAAMALTLHTTRSFWERALCGPPIEFELCEPPTTASSSTAQSPHHQHNTHSQFYQKNLVGK
ncbi:hypothetical protein ACA910_016788 [Epithemia clementina (nom. ined.)]